MKWFRTVFRLSHGLESFRFKFKFDGQNNQVECKKLRSNWIITSWVSTSSKKSGKVRKSSKIFVKAFTNIFELFRIFRTCANSTSCEPFCSQFFAFNVDGLPPSLDQNKTTTPFTIIAEKHYKISGALM